MIFILKRTSFIVIIFSWLIFVFSSPAQDFSTLQVSKFSFPSELTSSSEGNQIAWAMNEQGKRNVYWAVGPDFEAQRLTDFMVDDGQEISSLQFSPDGQYLVFVRGGDHGGGNASQPANVLHTPMMPKVEIWQINLQSKAVKPIIEGDYPTLGPSHQMVFLKNNQIWEADLEGKKKPASIIESKGRLDGIQFSPDGKQLAFVANRGDHAFIGIYSGPEKSMVWLTPSFQVDQSPRWSPDGKQLAFVRTQGGEGADLPLLEPVHRPWEIWIADASTGECKMRWKAPETLRGSVPSTHGGFNLHWAASNQLAYLSYEDGWPHLYAMEAQEGEPRLLTPGDYMVEQIRLHPSGDKLVFAANGGNQEDDIDRRHLGEVDITSGHQTWKTEGEGIEAYPVYIGKSDDIAFFSATPKRPLLPAILSNGAIKLLGEDLIPEDFPSSELVIPKQVHFTAADGTRVYGQLFEPTDNTTHKPAVVFVHGGPQRQMLLGWSYMDYYSNTYAINQKLAEMGFVVLSVNYRLGIGYGYEFHRPSGTYYQGAAEYQDIKAAGEYLAGLDQVDPDRIGIYGGSYGGYLTSLALARDSELFKAGVDISGVHDMDRRYDFPQGFEVAPDYEEAKRIAWESSPMPDLDQWTSPVLFIHSDDDRNVNFSHSADLVRRFEQKNKPYEYLVIPGDTHHWMKFTNMVKVNEATVEFLGKHLLPR